MKELSNRFDVTVIVPVLNEEENVLSFHKAINDVFSQKLSSFDWELIFVDDGSTDCSSERVQELTNADSRVKVIRFSRNFGHQAALTAGMERAGGDVVITMDCDLQDPPELIPELIKKWEQGNKVVYARRTVRVEGFFKKVTASFYYWLLSRVSDVDIPRQVGDFRLMDRVVVRNLLTLDEHARYLRGMVAWLGFKHDFVDFERPERVSGETHYTLQKMVKLAMDGLLNFSFSPLKIGVWIGAASIFVSLGFMGYMLYDHFVNGVTYRLFKWLMVVLFGFMGSQFIILWILGEYIGRIYNDVRKRPLYVISEELNLGDDNTSQGSR
ncbi:MAG: glycosyltransferase family 2 protein [Kiritimatiellae bacterium]|nr:glycosyltransferase family 2 protein [Kiritimatiellia bacterium]